MGKVRKLRKKYQTLCSKDKKPNNESKQNSSSELSISRSSENGLQSSVVSNTVSSIEGDIDKISIAKSTYSISKSIKSSLGGMRIQKKQKQKLRQELFLKRLDVSKKTLDSLKKNKKKVKKITLRDDLPDLKLFEECNQEFDKGIEKKNKVVSENLNRPRKGIVKYRNRQVAQNVQHFQTILKNSSFMKNQYMVNNGSNSSE